MYDGPPCFRLNTRQGGYRLSEVQCESKDAYPEDRRQHDGDGETRYLPPLKGAIIVQQRYRIATAVHSTRARLAANTCGALTRKRKILETPLR